MKRKSVPVIQPAPPPKQVELPFGVPTADGKTDKQKLDLLIQWVTESVPYIEATISDGNTFRSEKRPDWIEIHEGRAISSRNQLSRLVSLAKEFKK